MGLLALISIMEKSNKGEDDEGVFKIMQYSEMECNCVRKITKGYLESTVRYDSTSVKVK
jgi:hypothetical protein